LERHIITPLETDIFLHTWNYTHFYADAGPANKTWYGKEIPGWQDFDREYAIHCLNFLRPRRFIVEAPKQFDDVDYYMEQCTPENNRMQAKSYWNVISMYYSILMSQECMLSYANQHNINYDYVIRSRTDLLFYDTPTLTEAVGTMAENAHGGLNDMFAVGSLTNMNTYATCYLNLRNLFDSGCNFHPESFLKKHLEINSVPHQHITQCYELIRS
jgi:hypothetical protein